MSCSPGRDATTNDGRSSGNILDNVIRMPMDPMRRVVLSALARWRDPVHLRPGLVAYLDEDEEESPYTVADALRRRVHEIATDWEGRMIAVLDKKLG